MTGDDDENAVVDSRLEVTRLVLPRLHGGISQQLGDDRVNSLDVDFRFGSRLARMHGIILVQSFQRSSVSVERRVVKGEKALTDLSPRSLGHDDEVIRRNHKSKRK